MKILQINSVYEFSSTGRTTTEMHEYLVANGHSSYVVAHNIQSENQNLIKMSSRIDMGLHSIMSKLTGRQGYFSYWHTKNLIKRIDEIRPDVVHLRVLHSNCIHIPLLLKYLGDNNIATVVTLHDCWFFTGHCCYFTDSKCEKWKNECGQCPDLHTWNKSWFFDRTKDNLLDKRELFGNINRLAIIGVSDWVTSFVKDSILKDAKIVRRIYNWIDLEKFKPTQSNVRQKYDLDGDFVVLGVAQNWGIQKGILDVKEVASRMPECKFLLVGNVPEQYYPLPKNIVVAGVTSSVQELVEFYSAADVFFNPSTRETFGKVTVEALSCGTPVVAYNLTATPELVSPSCGFVVEYKDYDNIISSLNSIKSSGKQSYSNSCISFARENFLKEKLLQDYLSLYEELVKMQ